MTEQKKPYRIEGRPRTIYRTVKNVENPFVMIDRRPIDNPNLSYKAKGILTYLMSRPDGWEVSVADLINHSTEGEASVRSGLKQLKLAGHMKYTKMRDKGRITGWLIEVYEAPHLSPDGDFQDVEKPHVENRGQVLLNLSIKEVKKHEDDEALATISKTYSSEIGMITPMIADELREASTAYPVQWTLDAIKEAATQNKRGWKYILAILTRWKSQGNQEAMKRPNAQPKQSPLTKQDQSLLNIQSWLAKQDNPNGI